MSDVHFPTGPNAEAITVVGRFKVLTEASCLDCKDSLDIHQPDERNPDRLLGICASCGAWYLLEVAGADGHAASGLIARLPEPGVLKRSAEAPTTPTKAPNRARRRRD